MFVTCRHNTVSISMDERDTLIRQDPKEQMISTTHFLNFFSLLIVILTPFAKVISYSMAFLFESNLFKTKIVFNRAITHSLFSPPSPLHSFGGARSRVEELAICLGFPKN